MGTKSNETVAAMKEEILQLRDEIRLRLHLGSMEVRKRFAELEPGVNRFERRAERATEEVSQELREGYEHLRAALKRIGDELHQRKQH